MSLDLEELDELEDAEVYFEDTEYEYEPLFETALSNHIEQLFKMMIGQILQFLFMISFFLYFLQLVDPFILMLVDVFTTIGLWGGYVSKKLRIISEGSKYSFIYIIQRTGGQPIEYVFFITEYEEIPPTIKLSRDLWKRIEPSFDSILQTVFGQEAQDFGKHLVEAERWRTFLFKTIEQWEFILIAPEPIENILYFFPSDIPYRGWTYPSKIAYAEVIELTRIPNPDQQGVMIPIFFLILGDRFPIIRPPEKELVLAELVARLNLYRAVQYSIALEYAKQNINAVKTASKQMIQDLKNNIENLIKPYLKFLQVRVLAKDVERFKKEEEREAKMEKWGWVKDILMFLGGMSVATILLLLVR